MNALSPSKLPPPIVGAVLERLVGGLDRLRRAITPAPALMMETIVEQFVVGRCLHVATSLGMADRLADGPRAVDDLARDVGADADTLTRVMRLLASKGIFAEPQPGRFAATRLSACLRADAPESLREWALYNDTASVWPAWSAFPTTVRNGKSLYENAYDTRFFDWLARDPELARSFDMGMTRFSRALAPAIVGAYDFSQLGSVVDVGGGEGVLLARLLERYPALRGTLFDREEVVKRAEIDGPCAAGDVRARCDFAAGDIFESVPAGADAYVLKWILHDWRDDECLKILASCRHAMEGSGASSGRRRLLVVEMVLEERAPSTTKLAMDVVMLSLSGGRERTEAQYRELLRKGGFELLRVVPTLSPLAILEAVPI